MTAKEEAKELVDRFLKEFPSTDDIGFGQIKIAKRCALICADKLQAVYSKYQALGYVEHYDKVKLLLINRHRDGDLLSLQKRDI